MESFRKKLVEENTHTTLFVYSGKKHYPENFYFEDVIMYYKIRTLYSVHLNYAVYSLDFFV